MDTPASLLVRLRQPGDKQAWNQFVELYTPLLYRWARRDGLQDADAADLVQEVLTLLFRKLPEFSYDRRRSFHAWLRTVTRNKWREKLRRATVLIAEGGSALDAAPAVDDFAANEEAEYRQHVVAQALAALKNEFPPTAWNAFHEVAVAGRPPAEVAREMGVRIGTVYAARSRVMSRLRQELDGLLD
jgi:RNA polymerase sigma-70 factor (ECF subfamily)